jgi:hypothetical protein
MQCFPAHLEGNKEIWTSSLLSRSPNCAQGENKQNKQTSPLNRLSAKIFPISTSKLPSSMSSNKRATRTLQNELSSRFPDRKRNKFMNNRRVASRKKPAEFPLKSASGYRIHSDGKEHNNKIKSSNKKEWMNERKSFLHPKFHFSPLLVIPGNVFHSRASTRSAIEINSF